MRNPPPRKIRRHSQNALAAFPRLRIQQSHFLDFLLLDHPRQIGFDHRPFHFQRLNIRFFFDGLNGSRFFEFYPRLEKRLCQPRAEAGIGSLRLQRFDLPRAERL